MLRVDACRAIVPQRSAAVPPGRERGAAGPPGRDARRGHAVSEGSPGHPGARPSGPDLDHRRARVGGRADGDRVRRADRVEPQRDGVSPQVVGALRLRRARPRPKRRTGEAVAGDPPDAGRPRLVHSGRGGRHGRGGSRVHRPKPGAGAGVHGDRARGARGVAGRHVARQRRPLADRRGDPEGGRRLRRRTRALPGPSPRRPPRRRPPRADHEHGRSAPGALTRATTSPSRYSKATREGTREGNEPGEKDARSGDD